MSTFGSTLRDMRLGKGLSRLALAREMGVRHQLICKWEQGTHVPATHSASFHALKMVLGERAGEILREHIRAERVMVGPFRCLGREEHERRALALFQRAWNQRTLSEDVVNALEAALKGVEFNDAGE